jgi:phage-related protein
LSKRWWRDYRTPAGRRPVKEFIAELDDADAEEVLAAMKDVQTNGLVAARHLRGEIYEVRAESARNNYRVLFATEGRRNRVLLALVVIPKKTQKTPAGTIDLAERRLRDWRARGRPRPRAPQGS